MDSNLEPTAVGRYKRDQSGGVYVMMLVMSLVLFAFIGLMLDSGRAYIEHTRMQSFVDATVTAAALELDGESDAIDRATAVLRGGFLSTRGSLSAGAGAEFEIGEVIFLRAPPGVGSGGSLDMAALKAIEVDPNDAAVATHIVATAAPRQVRWTLLNLADFNTSGGAFGVNAWASATVVRTPSQDIELTFAVDNSPSMLLGADLASIERMEGDSRFNGSGGEGCAFACHFQSGQNKSTLDLARADPQIELRLDVAVDAIVRAIDIANAAPTDGAASVYFDVNTFAREFEQVAAGEASAALANDVERIDVVPKLTGSDVRCGHNVFEMSDPRTLNTLTTMMESKLTLSATRDRKHTVVIITDGLANYSDNSVSCGGTRTRIDRPFTAADCGAIKDLGVDVAVIYTTYIDFPLNNAWRNSVRPYTTSLVADSANSPRAETGRDNALVQGLRSCASRPDLFFEAAFTDDINAAFEEILARQFKVTGAVLAE